MADVEISSGIFLAQNKLCGKENEPEIWQTQRIKNGFTIKYLTPEADNISQ